MRNRKKESAQISVAIVGAAGRIGRALVRCSQSFPRLRIAAAIERAGHP
ncbi:MAG: 4-hydroxy-tetrahydrodipicolinate reductase, partial [Lentisphaerae bacterium]|nr:4-hydroxy-tetrahydrodipicolinate reductase [Lentisphaerota bacterium]